MLEKIPKNKSKIAVIVNSKGGCLAQTHLIIKKINDVARRNKAQVWTFAQEWALNAGFLLLASGNRVYIDSSSVVGGLEVGESKLLRGKVGEYIETVSYSSAPSYLSELKSNGPIDAAKKAEIEQIYSRFSSELNLEIRKLRENKISTNSDLKGWFVGEEAVRAGLADQVGGIHSAFGLKEESSLIDKGDLEKMLERIRKLNISD